MTLLRIITAFCNVWKNQIKKSQDDKCCPTCGQIAKELVPLMNQNGVQPNLEELMT